MGFFSRLFNNRTVSSNLSLDELMILLKGGNQAKSGVTVTWDTALEVTTVQACVRKIADGLLVPLKIYKRDKDGQRLEAREHPLSDIFESMPNEFQGAYDFREQMALHLTLSGNSFAFINRVGGKVKELLPFLPNHVTVNKDKNRVVSYEISNGDGETKKFAASQIWHVRGPTWDGVNGLDAVRLAREAIGLALATEQSHASIHKNGMSPSGILSVDSALDEANLVRLAAWVKANFTGIENSHRAMVLDRKAKWTPLRMTGVDSEHIKTREMQIFQICQGFNVLPEVIGVPSNNTSYASVEQVYIAHLVHTVRPWHDRVRMSIDRWLLTADERKQGYYSGFVAAAFLQPAMKDKAEFNKIALGGGGNPGWLTPNEVRAFEELPPVDGGDSLYAPTNVGPVAEDGRPWTPKQDPQPAAPAVGGKVAVSSDRLAVGRVLSAENERILRESSTLLGEADGKLAEVLKKLDKQEEE